MDTQFNEMAEGGGAQAINELVGSAGGAMFGLIVHSGIVEWIV